MLNITLIIIIIIIILIKSIIFVDKYDKENVYI